MSRIEGNFLPASQSVSFRNYALLGTVFYLSATFVERVQNKLFKNDHDHQSFYKRIVVDLTSLTVGFWVTRAVQRHFLGPNSFIATHLAIFFAVLKGIGYLKGSQKLSSERIVLNPPQEESQPVRRSQPERDVRPQFPREIPVYQPRPLRVPLPEWVALEQQMAAASLAIFQQQLDLGYVPLPPVRLAEGFSPSLVRLEQQMAELQRQQIQRRNEQQRRAEEEQERVQEQARLVSRQLVEPGSRLQHQRAELQWQEIQRRNEQQRRAEGAGIGQRMLERERRVRGFEENLRQREQQPAAHSERERLPRAANPPLEPARPRGNRPNANLRPVELDLHHQESNPEREVARNEDAAVRACGSLTNVQISLLREKRLIEALPEDESVNFVDSSMVEFLTKGQIKFLRQKKLIEALPEDERVNSVDPSMIKFLTEDQLEYLTLDKIAECSDKSLETAAALSALVSMNPWPGMKLNREKLKDLQIPGFNPSEKILEINNYSALEMFSSVSQRLLINTDKVNNTRSRIGTVLLYGGNLTGFLPFNTSEGKAQRQEVLYRIKHITYALKRALDQGCDETSKQVYKEYLNAFLDKVSGGECKDGWESALDQFASVCHDYCDCEACIHWGDETGLAMLALQLNRKLALFKEELFQSHIIKKCQGRDGQNPHTRNWYAWNLPELGIRASELDINVGCALGIIPPAEMKKSFLSEYGKGMYRYIENLFSYKNGDAAMRDLLLDTVKGWIKKDAAESLSEEQIMALASKIIWDESYKVRFQIVYILTLSLGHTKLSKNLEGAGIRKLKKHIEFLAKKFYLQP